ncbi:unnamed protein product, partial [Brassica napus]
MAKVSKLMISFFIIVLLLITFPAFSCGAHIRFTHSDHDTAVSKERQQQYLLSLALPIANLQLPLTVVIWCVYIGPC